jgi:hypothetical protein
LAWAEGAEIQEGEVKQDEFCFHDVELDGAFTLFGLGFMCMTLVYTPPETR